MSTMHQFLLKVLRILRFARDRIGRTVGRWFQFVIALLGRRRLGEWPRTRQGKPGTFQNPKLAEPSFPWDVVGPNSVSNGGSATVLKDYVVAGSRVPASASEPSSHESVAPNAANLDQPPQVHPSLGPYPTLSSYGVYGAKGSTSNLSAISIQSRASDRLSIITTRSRNSIVDPVGQPSQLPKAIHRQFGRGPDPSRSVDRLSSRPPSPTNRPHTPHHAPHLEIVTTNLSSSSHGHEGVSPLVQPSASSTHRTLSTRPIRRRQSSMVIVDVQNPSTESLPITDPTWSPAIPQQLTAEPLAMATTCSSPASAVTDLRPESSLLSSTASSSEISDFLVPEGRFVQLIHSEQVPRYTKCNTISREQKPYDIHPLTTIFPYFPDTDVRDHDLGQQDCTPWLPATHPDGALYFYDPERRLFTDTDMHDPELKEEMEHFYLYLQDILRAENLTIPSGNCDLVLDIMPTVDGRMQWSYYYACHETRCLFWLEMYDGNFMISELDGVYSPAHVKHRLEALYWNHWSLFPAKFRGRRLPRRVYDELMGTLVHGCVDMMTSKSSTLPYDDETMRKMIPLVQQAKEAKGGQEFYTAGTTRLLSFFAHWRFLHFHGQRHARLVRDVTVYDKPTRERSILITFLSPFFFLAPEVHLREMEILWTDGIIIETVWKNFMTKLLKEWNEIILLSTVMLTVNVGFLAIPGVILYFNNGDPLENIHQVAILPSSSQIVSSFSIEASIGSIVIGLLLARFNRTKQEADPSEASTYLHKNSRKRFGLEPMAIIFSLPWAFLMWSMVTFSVAFLLFCFVISNIWTRIFITLMSASMAVFTVWCIWTTSEFGDGEAWLDGIQPSITRALHHPHTLGRGPIARVKDFARRAVRSLRNCLPSSSHTSDGGDRNVP